MQASATPSSSGWPADSQLITTVESAEEAEVMAQLLSSYSLSSGELGREPTLGLSSMFSAVESSYYNLDGGGGGHLTAAPPYYWLQDGSGAAAAAKDHGGLLLAGMESCYLPGPSSGADASTIDASPAPMDFFLVEEENGGSVLRGRSMEGAGGHWEASSEDNFGDPDCREHISLCGRKCRPPPKRKLPVVPSPPEKPVHGGMICAAAAGGGPSKKSRPTVEIQETKLGKNSQQKKIPKSAKNEDGEEIVAGAAEKEGDRSSDSSSEEEVSTALHHHTMNGRSESCTSPNQRHGKSAGSRGSATDPQSLYARRRRERINERLRILQSLIPNGTKVDISTMLEEAVRYVKFLQLQIKLLSSDELWMYAPLAYNGMDIGLM